MADLTLYKFGPAFGLPDPSSFVLKLETYLRMAEIDYKPVNGNVRKAPKAKLPSMKLNGRHIGDSELCIAALKQEFGDKLPQPADAKTRAQQQALRLALENHSYFLAIFYRWLTPENAALIRETFFSELGVMGGVIFKMVQRGYRRTLYGQGILRYTAAEMEALLAKDIEMMVGYLGDAPYFGGDEPQEIDCTLFGIIANIIVPEMAGPLGPLSRKEPTLVAYHNRMTKRFFPDYEATMLWPEAAG